MIPGRSAEALSLLGSSDLDVVPECSDIINERIEVIAQSRLVAQRAGFKETVASPVVTHSLGFASLPCRGRRPCIVAALRCHYRAQWVAASQPSTSPRDSGSVANCQLPADLGTGTRAFSSHCQGLGRRCQWPEAIETPRTWNLIGDSRGDQLFMPPATPPCCTEVVVRRRELFSAVQRNPWAGFSVKSAAPAKNKRQLAQLVHN